jgi:hypothetical protein
MTELTTPQLIFPEFDDIKVSTKTFIVMTNLENLKLENIFNFLEITDYTIVPKKRGRKKKTESVDPNKDIIAGSIISVKFENQLKGVNLKEKKSHSHHNTAQQKKKKYFRNSLTVIMIIDNKPINFKICKNGMFQITGCKFDSHPEMCIRYIWSLLKHQTDNELFNLKNNSEELECIFIPVMRNIDFSVGFNIDREKLSKYMSTQTQFYSLLESSFGYTGVNVKIKLKDDIRTMKIKKIKYEHETNDEDVSMITYGDYLETLPQKERLKRLQKERYNTFLVFHSGRIINSGVTGSFMKETYYDFLDVIKKGYHHIVEKLEN